MNRGADRLVAEDGISLPQCRSCSGEAFQHISAGPDSQHFLSNSRRTHQIHHIIVFKMVSTRGHPKDFPEPDLTPTRSTPSRAQKGKWAHTPSNLAIGWLLLSLPLVAWDTGYIMLRPHTMPGGKLQWPLYVPYELYGQVDYIYGWKAYNERNGFTSAQGSLNVIESLMYFYYLYILYAFGIQSALHGRGSPKPSTVGFWGQQRAVEGRAGALAVLVGHSAAVMTVSKTVLYCRFAASYR